MQTGGMRILSLLLLALPVVAEEAAPKPAPVKLTHKGATTADAKKALESHPAFRRVEFAPQVAKLKVDLDCGGLTPEQAIEHVAKAFGCEAQSLGDKRWRIAPAWQIAILKKIDGAKGVALTIQGRSLREVLDIFTSAAGLAVHLDREVDSNRKLTLQVNKVSYRALLDLITEPNELAWELRYGVIYIATPDKLKKMPLLPPRIPGMEKRRVQLAFEKVSIVMAANYMAAAAGVRVTVPKGVKARTVTVRAHDVTVPQAFALLCYPWGMSATVADGAVQIRAGAQREEED